MSRLKEREIARRLAEPLDAEPPEGLLDRIKAEIPPVLEVGTAIKGINPPGGEVKPFPLPAATPEPRRQRWLIAASLAVAVVGGLLAWNLQFLGLSKEEMEVPEPTTSRTYSDLPEGGALVSPPPPPPAVRAPGSYPAPAKPEPGSETAQLQRDREGEMDALGYLGSRQELANPAAPAPREEQERFADEVTVVGE